MVELYFVPFKCPRTWTKAEWKENYRWVRVTRKVLKAEMEKKRAIIAEQMNNLGAFGTSHPHIYKMLNDMVNPPLIYGPGMEPK